MEPSFEDSFALFIDRSLGDSLPRSISGGVARSSRTLLLHFSVFKEQFEMVAGAGLEPAAFGL